MPVSRSAACGIRNFNLMPKLLDLKSTLNLPKTAFPMKANLPQNEPRILAEWEQTAPLPTHPAGPRGRADLRIA